MLIGLKTLIRKLIRPPLSNDYQAVDASNMPTCTLVADHT